MNGWIKIHRALADHPVASDPSSLSVWIHLLMMANHKEVKRQINGQIITLKAGQLITSRKSIAEKTGVQESKVERVLKMLKSEQQIEQVGTTKFRVISIVNWREYQIDEQETEQQTNNKRTADEQQMNTPEEVSISPSGDTDTQEGKEGEENNVIGQQADLLGGGQKKRLAVIPYEKIREAFEKHCKGLPQPKNSSEWTDARKRRVKSLWNKREAFGTVDFFERFFEYSSKSDFLMGRETSWSADFDWLLKPENFQKVVEGKYHKE